MVANRRPPPSDWALSLGGGVLALPSYLGSSSILFLPLPFIAASYKDSVFLSTFDGLGVNFVTAPRVRIGVATPPELGRWASSSDRLRGWGDISFAVSAKLFARVEIVEPIALIASVRRQLGAANGTLVEAAASSTFPRTRHFIFSTTASVTWANALYMQSYFGVTPAQSAMAASYGELVPAYAASAGFRDAALTLSATVPFDRHWSLQSVVLVRLLLGDAQHSPVTERRLQPTFSGFVAYNF